MSTITIRDLPDEAHAALKERAAKTGRSQEAELRAIIAEALFGPQRLLTAAEWERLREQPITGHVPEFDLAEARRCSFCATAGSK